MDARARLQRLREALRRRGPVGDFLILLGGLVLFLVILWVYTGVWPPAVIVESSSMMHADSDVTYGRIGTIDPGDLVLVKQADAPDDVVTQLDGGRNHYGKPGDVIVYYPANDRRGTPIIHRAVAYVDVEGEGTARTYRVRWDPDVACAGGSVKDPQDARWCVFGEAGIRLPAYGIEAFGGAPYKPNRDGFLTKGDNPVTNRQLDQVSGISHDARNNPSVVLMEWVEGKSRAELPWLGLLKLALSSTPNEDHPPEAYVKIGNAYAPKDLWVMLGASLLVLVGGPMAWDGYKWWKKRRAK